MRQARQLLLHDTFGANLIGAVFLRDGAVLSAAAGCGSVPSRALHASDRSLTDGQIRLAPRIRFACPWINDPFVVVFCVNRTYQDSFSLLKWAGTRTLPRGSDILMTQPNSAEHQRAGGYVRPQWLVGAAAVLVVIAVVLGTRLARFADPESAAVAGSSASPTPVTAGDLAAVRPGGSDDLHCADDAGSAAGQVAASTAEPTLEATKSRLLVSQSAENLTSVALMAVDDPRERLDAIKEAMSIGDRDAIVVWAAVQICDRPRPNLNCPAREWEDELLKLDSGNSEVWIRVAARHYQRGDTAKALDSLRHAATAAETREYWPETVAMLERALDAAGGYSFTQRARFAFDFAAAHAPDAAPYVSMCGTQSRIDAEWAQACLEYGRLVERQGKTESVLAIGQTIQIAALEAMGNTAATETVAAQQDEAARERASEPAGERVDVFILSNTRLFAAYLAALRERGERAARAEARAEANRLAERCSQQRTN